LRSLVLLMFLAACGRLSFDDVVTDDGRRDAGDDAAVSTGPLGPRWMTKYNDTYSRIVGANGQVAMVASYSGTFYADNVAPMSGAGFTNSAVIRWDTDGSVLSSSLFENDGFCDLRGIVLDGSDVVVAGFAIASQGLPSYGPCGVVASRQQPIIARLDPGTDQRTPVARWTASGVNAQGWSVALMPDGTFTNAGIYGQSLTIGSTVLPTAASDPSLWITRTSGVVNDATWARSATAATPIQPGPLAADGDEVCMLASHSSAATVFGTSIPFVGGSNDVFVVRFDGGGNAKFVRAIGSTGNDSTYNDGAIVALPDGGCMVGIDAPGDVTLDSVTYPATSGGGLSVRFSATGAVTSARRIATDVYVATVGSRVFGTYRVDAAVMIGSTMYMPSGSDVVIVELGASPSEDVLLAAIGGAGFQDAFGIATVGPDAIAFMAVSNGIATFGPLTLDTLGGSRVVGVLGI
jgi:hypothetical protein